MSAIVLVHGAFRGGWAWRGVRAHLVAAGHDVHAPSLLGAGEHVAQLAAVTGLDVWVDQVVRLIELEDLREVVLVGHSQGGLVTTGVASAIPDRIAVLVHLDAALPLPGERAVDLLGAPEVLPPRTATVPPQSVAVSGEYDVELAAWVDARTTPSPVAVALDPVGAVPEGIRQVHAFCSRTPEGYPSTVVRARLDELAGERGADYLLLDAGHDAPLSAPALVAALLLEAASSPAGQRG